MLSGQSGYPLFGVYNGANGGTGAASSSLISLNTWTHLAATFSGGSMTLYMNGVQVGTSSQTVNSVTRTNNFIGRSNWANDGNFSGNIDELRIWNYARSQAQIQASMSAALYGSESGLILYYRFDEGAGSTATNWATATGSASNGALYLSALYSGGAPISEWWRPRRRRLCVVDA